MISVDEIHQKIKERNYPAADSLIESGIHREPDNADLYYLRGLLRSYQGKLVNSIEDLKHCLKTDPKHTDAAVCLSIVLNDIGHYDEAKKVFEQANQSVFFKQASDSMQVNQKFAMKHFELGDLYFRHRRFDESIEEYNKAIILDPANIETRVKRAKSKAKKGYITGAIQDLQQLKVEHPHNSMVGIQLGLLHYSQGNALDAQIEWDAVLENDPVNREAIAYLELLMKGN